MAKILFIASHDWLFAARHLPAIRAARELGLEAVVVAKATGRMHPILQAGARFVDGNLVAGGLSPLRMARLVLALRRLIMAEGPAIVHGLGARPALLGALAAMLSGHKRRIIALDGLGVLGRRKDVLGTAGLAAARLAIPPLVGPGGALLFANPDDPVVLGLSDPDGSEARRPFTVLPGPGADPLIHAPESMPWSPPLKLVFGSPLLFANGPDIAVEAVGRARRLGAAVTLSLVGRACTPGREAVPEATLTAWSRLPGITWYAPATDPSQVWRQHHALILPSRGGDGLPPLMVEAASSGRAIITSDAPGCRSFVRDGVDGVVVTGAEANSLAAVLVQLAKAPGLVERMGRSARERVLDGYTERHVMEALKQVWRRMLQTGVEA